jgi:hypothetical protein
MTQQVFQRPDWYGEPKELGELFILAKKNNLRARCLLYSHQFGFELRLVAGAHGELLRSQVCRTDAEILDTQETWKVALLAEGWTK